MSGSSGIDYQGAARASDCATEFLQLLQNRVVDEARGADPRGDGKERAGRGGFDGPKRGPVDEGDVVDRDLGLGGKDSVR